jgi:hypothetical protein
MTFRWFHGTKLVAILGMITVLIYPTILALLGLATASWVTRGNPLGFLGTAGDVSDYESLVRPDLSRPVVDIPWLNWFHFGTLQGFDGVTAFLPVIFLVILSVGVRGRLWAAIAGVLLVLVQIPASYLPITFPSGYGFVLITVIAIILVSEERRRISDKIIIAACFFQLALGWLTVFLRPATLTAWVDLLWQY